MSLHRTIAKLCSLLCLTAGLSLATVAQGAAPDFNADVLPLFRKYCNGCHSGNEAEAGLVLVDFKQTLKGGEGGAIIKGGDSQGSRLWQVISGTAEPRMPPKDSPQPTDAERNVIRDWINAGALAPRETMPAKKLVTPQIVPRGEIREPVVALDVDPQNRWLAIGRPKRVEIVTVKDRQPVSTLEGQTGVIADTRFSHDGEKLLVAAGEIGLSGEATVWQTADWKRGLVINGHQDALYAASFSPDGQSIATASYDRDARLWNASNGEPISLMAGHNDALYGLAFHPSGRWIATASGDRTVKLWNAATGERLDTFSQPAKELYSVDISPDGRLVAAGGVDCRIRVWELSSSGQEGTNPILYARFAHEAPILKVVFSPDGRLLVSCSEERRIKIWETKTFTQVAQLEVQPDWPSAVTFSADSRQLFVGRMDGSLGQYAVEPEWTGEVIQLARLPESPAMAEAAMPVTTEVQKIAEVEPNDQWSQSQAIVAPATVSGRFENATSAAADTDLFRFHAEAGQVWILETSASREKSPADTRLEVLHADGRPVRRALLQAVRDSWINFRPIDSSQLQVRVEYWDEMDLNQFLYMNGEIGKFYRAPRGPDSGYDFYENRGKRRTYFDTTPMTHAKDEPVYIVEAYPPTAPIIENGLPVFAIDYVNDDDAERELGSDSRLTFTAPATGDYLVRVSETRGFKGENFTYQLTVRPPQPGFVAKLETQGIKVAAGSGQRVKFSVDRVDNFNGPVRIEVNQLPPGFHVAGSTTVEAGHLEAFTVLTATSDAVDAMKEDWARVTVTAIAEIAGREVRQSMGSLGEVTLEKPPAIRVVLLPDEFSTTAADGGLVLTPGKTVTARIRVERNGFDGDVKFDVDNLPHGVIVDNIGLSGVLVRASETERQISLTARPWVPASTRWIYAVAQGQGNVATAAIPLHISPTEVVAGVR